MASIKLVLITAKADSTGECPIYIRLIKNRKVKYVTTSVKVKPNQWDEETQRIKKNKTNSARLNAFLSQKRADADALIADEERTTKSVSARKLKEAIKGKASLNFFNYADSRIKKMEGNLSVHTIRNYKLYVEKFKTFAANEEVFFEDITVTMLNDYVAYMSNKLKNGATTQNYSLLILSIFFKQAIGEELIPATNYPFSKVKVKKDQGKRLFLNKDQFKQFKELELDPASKEYIYRDMFMFSVFAGGLRFSDVISLKWSHYNKKEQRISKVIRKTGRLHQLRIADDAVSILNRYNKKGQKENDFVFPLIEDPAFFDENVEYQYRMIENNISLCGQKFRKIGKDMKLPFTLSFHLSRHTFATNALNNGMRIEFVSKLLDHADISTTQIYAKVISEELDKSVDSFVKM